MLKIKNLNVSYGAIHAVHDISLEVNDGEIVSLIGANGAGKTTILHTITGLKSATSGEITYNDLDLRRTEPSKLISYGIGHVPEGRHIFPTMTVQENLEMGAFAFKEGKDQMRDRMEDLFKRFPRLKERRKQIAGTLSGGEQQMLAMCRALMGKPKILLMDEPSMGLSPILVKEIFNIIQDCHSQGITILLVEQNAKMALSIADRAYVLETGDITIQGEARTLLQDDRIRKAYLGQ
jgi:branched-chain amino acid transport system ATP-binding protein